MQQQPESAVRIQTSRDNASATRLKTTTLRHGKLRLTDDLDCSSYSSLSLMSILGTYLKTFRDYSRAINIAMNYCTIFIDDKLNAFDVETYQEKENIGEQFSILSGEE